jgi:hypothetical protein
MKLKTLHEDEKGSLDAVLHAVKAHLDSVGIKSKIDQFNDLIVGYHFSVMPGFDDITEIRVYGQPPPKFKESPNEFVGSVNLHDPDSFNQLIDLIAKAKEWQRTQMEHVRIIAKAFKPFNVSLSGTFNALVASGPFGSKKFDITKEGDWVNVACHHCVADQDQWQDEISNPDFVPNLTQFARFHLAHH